MTFVLFSIVLAAASLILCDYLRKKKHMSAELARKIPHMVSGCAMAFWPWYISWTWIAILAFGYLAAAIIAKQLGLFDNVRTVKRASWGEYFYPIGIIILSIMQPENIVFAVAVLHFGLADAIAAMVGSAFVKGKGAYKVFGQPKTIMGSLTFWYISAVLVGILVLQDPVYQGTQWVLLLVIPAVATALENVGTYGADNLLVPVAVAFLLQVGVV